jgi:hypothetical protein
MPGLNFTVPNMAEMGPVLPIKVIPSTAMDEILKTEGKPAPAPVDALVMVDTGASLTLLTREVITALHIEPIGSVPLSTITGSDDCRRFQVQIMLPNGLVSGDIVVVEPKQLHGGIQGLIGRDMLRAMLFVYNGPTNQFTLYT